MPSKYASGKNSIAECDRCGQRYKLKELRKLIIKTKQVNIKVCQECWEPDQPQLSLGMYPVNDPQAVREPRPDVSYTVSGSSGLQINGTNDTTLEGVGYQEGGSRIFQWGWNPVGGARDDGLTPNDLAPSCLVGSVTVTITQELDMFKKDADGIAKKGKTEGRNLGDSGPSVLGMKSKPKMGGKDQNVMKKIGRNLAKVQNQGMRKSAGRGR